jgi:hypothetical protein
VQQRKRLGDLGHRECAIITRAQPYHTNPKLHPLCWLNTLDNLDKHRRVLAVGGIASIPHFSFRRTTPVDRSNPHSFFLYNTEATFQLNPQSSITVDGDQTRLLNNGRVEHDGQAVAEINLPPGPPLDVNIETQPLVVFGNASGEATNGDVLDTLLKIIEHTEGVVRSFT